MKPNDCDRFAGFCREMVVPIDVCALRFSSERGVSGEHIGDTTRGEMLILHHNAAGQIVSIELVSDDKPCQVPLVMH